MVEGVLRISHLSFIFTIPFRISKIIFTSSLFHRKSLHVSLLPSTFIISFLLFSECIIFLAFAILFHNVQKYVHEFLFYCHSGAKKCILHASVDENLGISYLFSVFDIFLHNNQRCIQEFLFQRRSLPCEFVIFTLFLLLDFASGVDFHHPSPFFLPQHCFSQDYGWVFIHSNT